MVAAIHLPYTMSLLGDRGLMPATVGIAADSESAEEYVEIFIDGWKHDYESDVGVILELTSKLSLCPRKDDVRRQAYARKLAQSIPSTGTTGSNFLAPLYI